MKALFIFILLTVSCFAKTTRVGIVFDWREDDAKEIVDGIRNNLNAILDNPKSVNINSKKVFFGEDNLEQIKSNLKKVINDKEIDFIIAIGPINSYGMILRDKLDKPVIVTHLFDRKLAHKKNLFAPKLYPDLEEVKEHFNEINSGKNILVVSQGVEPLKNYLGQIEKVLTPEYKVKFLNTREPILSEILLNTDLVFYTPKPFRTREEYYNFQKKVNEAHIKSYSISGTDDFKMGVLIAPEISNLNEKLSRVIALSLMDFKSGKSLEKLDTNFISFKKILSNKEFAGNFEAKIQNLSIISASKVEKALNPSLPKLFLQDAISKTLDQNFTYLTSKYAFERTEFQAKSAFSKFFPQIGILGISNIYKSPDSILLAPSTEEYSTLDFSLKQFVFSDDVLRDYDLRKYDRDSHQYKKDEVRIDVIGSTIEKYLFTLNLSSIIKIREENLALTSENLQIAQLNFRTGKTSKFEVYRWESQLADNQKELSSANFEYNKTLHELNRLMNVDLASHWNLENYDSLSELLVDKEVHLPDKHPTMESLEKYISFIIEESKTYNPIFKEAEQPVKAAERLLLNKDRAFYLPSIELFADYAILGSNNNDFENTAFLSMPNDWRVGLRLSFPLFESFNRFHERSTEVKRLNTTQAEKNDIYQQVEKSLRDQVIGIRTSFEQIKFEIDREKAAKSNLDLIKLSYKTGKVDILYLLDAQNFYLKAREGVVIAKNNFLLELVKLEKNMGDFKILRNANEEKDFQDRYRKIMAIKTN